MKPTFDSLLPKHHTLISRVKMTSVTKALSTYLFAFKTQVSAEKKCFHSTLKILLSLNNFSPLLFVL